MSSPGYGEIFFKNNRGTTAVCFDTCIWMSRIFKEENHSDPTRQRLGKIAGLICKKYPRKNNEYLILIDTITWEFRTIISFKAMSYGKKIQTFLTEASNRIKKGENYYEVIREYRKKIKDDSTINLLYDYFEYRGMGFSNLLNEKTRLDFFKELVTIPKKFDLLFKKETQKCLKRNVKERIVMWTTLNRNFFSKFEKKSPKIGKKDRFHILGCILIGLIDNKNTKFITYDKLLLNHSNTFEEFFNKHRPTLEKQVERLLEVESS